MSYATRGNSCDCSSIALTSNAKYIAPMSKVYYDPWTDMWMYPGHTGFTYPFQHPFGPEVLKAWNLDTPLVKTPGRRKDSNIPSQKKNAKKLIQQQTGSS